MVDDIAVSQETLRVHDRDRYLASLLVPEKLRSSFTALYAFNAEIARIRDRISEPIPGEIRLQWWRDAINSDENANPIASALLATIDQYSLPKDKFDLILSARIFDLYNDPLPSIDTLEAYAGETSSLLFLLSALMTGAQSSTALADACGHAGMAHTLTGILRSIGLHSSRGQLYLPLDILHENKCSADKVLNGEMHHGLADTIVAMSDLAREHLVKAEGAIENLPLSVWPAFLTLTLLRPYLRLVSKPGYNPFTERADLSQFRVQWALWRGTLWRGSLWRGGLWRARA